MPGPVLKQDRSVITLTAQEICQACSGELIAGTGSLPVGQVATDTREDLTGSLFVALKGEHFDGGDFVEQALDKGAAGVVAEADAARRLAAGLTDEGSGPVVIAVDDAGEALKKIASQVVSKSSARIVAITGSTGKTSTKDILYGLLRPNLKTVAGRASFNNEVGVPLTLLAADDDTQVIVVEMGMRTPGDIRELCAIAAPEIAIITNIGPAHLEFAGSLEEIARGKAEIAGGLKPGGALVVPYGDELLGSYLKGLDVETFTFGFDPRADVHPVGEARLEDGRLTANISCFGAEVEVRFGFAAPHHLLNAMAAMAACHLLGLSLEAAASAAAGVQPPGMRGELLALPGGGLLINDCYNANPLSTKSALEYLAAAGAGKRKVAILGDMAELGSRSEDYHREIGRLAQDLGIDCLVAVGELAANYLAAGEGAGSMEGHHFADLTAALTGVGRLLEPGDVVLVKASRFMQLEEISRLLTGNGSPGQPDVNSPSPGQPDESF